MPKSPKVDTAHLVQRHRTWSVILDVPRDVRHVLTPRLSQSLQTHSLPEAQKKRHAVLAEFHRRIDEARKQPKPEPETLASEAMRWADPENRVADVVDEEGTYDLHSLLLSERVDDLRDQEIPAAAIKSFVEIATGTATPIDAYLDRWISQNRYAATTVGQHRQVINELCRWCASKRVGSDVRSVTQRVAGKFVDDLFAKKGHPKTIARKLFSLRAYWRWLEQRSHAGENPWSKQSVQTRGSAGAIGEDEGRPFTDAEVLTLITGKTDKDVMAFILIGALSGMRIDEIASLRVGDCTAGAFNVRASKTNAGIRRVPIHSDLMALIGGRCGDRKATEWLFTGLPDKVDIKRSAAVGKRFKTYRVRVGVDEKVPGRKDSLVVFHSFRKWFVTRADSDGTKLSLVQQIVGHKPQHVTMKVYHGGFDIEVLRAVVESVRLPVGAPQESPKPPRKALP